MKLNLFDLLQASALDPDSPNILLNVRLSDLHPACGGHNRKPPASVCSPSTWRRSGTNQSPRKRVAERLGVCETTVYNMTKDGRLHPFKVNGSTRYSLREVNSIINPLTMTEPMEDVTVTPPAEGRFERIGTTYYKIVRQPNAPPDSSSSAAYRGPSRLSVRTTARTFSPTCQNTTVSAVFLSSGLPAGSRQFQEQVFATQPISPPRENGRVSNRSCATSSANSTTSVLTICKSSTPCRCKNFRFCSWCLRNATQENPPF